MDVDRVCLALGVSPDELADVARRESARRLREAAELLDDPDAVAIGALVSAESAGRWLVLYEQFDKAAEKQASGDEETETKPKLAAAASRESSRVEDWSEA